MGVHRTTAGCRSVGAAHHYQAFEAVRASGNHLEVRLGGQLEGLEVRHVSHRYALQLSNGTAQPAVEELGWRIGYGSFATVGAVIVSRRPRNRIGWMLCVVGLTSGVAGFAQDYATWALVDRPKWLPGGLSWAGWGPGPGTSPSG
jgi:hypothetical protein